MILVVSLLLLLLLRRRRWLVVVMGNYFRFNVTTTTTIVNVNCSSSTGGTAFPNENSLRNFGHFVVLIRPFLSFSLNPIQITMKIVF